MRKYAYLKAVLLDPEWFIPDPALNFRVPDPDPGKSSRSMQIRIQIQAILIEYKKHLKFKQKEETVKIQVNPGMNDVHGMVVRSRLNIFHSKFN